MTPLEWTLLRLRRAAVPVQGRRSVVDVALPDGTLGATEVSSRVLKRLRFGDAIFRHLTRAAALGVLALLGGVIIALLIGSIPALQAFGLGFLVEERWNPVTERFGAIAPIYGTIV